MTSSQIKQFPNLYFSVETLEFLSSKKIDFGKDDILHRLNYLNEFGANPNFLGKYLCKTSRTGVKELKGKGPSKTEWRFLFKKISKGESPAKYGVMIGFIKKDEKLKKKDLDTAERIAKREGW